MLLTKGACNVVALPLGRVGRETRHGPVPLEVLPVVILDSLHSIRAKSGALCGWLFDALKRKHAIVVRRAGLCGSEDRRVELQRV